MRSTVAGQGTELERNAFAITELDCDFRAGVEALRAAVEAEVADVMAREQRRDGRGWLKRACRTHRLLVSKFRRGTIWSDYSFASALVQGLSRREVSVGSCSGAWSAEHRQSK